MKNFILLLIIILNSLFVTAQSKTIGFISSCPDMSYSSRSEEFSYLTLLYIYKDGKFIVCDTVVGDSKLETRFLQIYHDLGFVIGSFGPISVSEDSIIIIDINMLEVKKRKQMFEDFFSYRNIIRKHDDYYYLTTNEIINNKLSFKGINRHFHVEDIQANDFLNAYIYGALGGIVDQSDYLTAYSNPTDGKLRIPRTKKIEDRPIFPIGLPDSLQLKKKELLLIPAINEKLFTIELAQSPDTESKDIGWSKIATYLKETGEWRTRVVKGDYLRILVFGEWLCGTSVSFKRTDYPMSGKEFRNQEITRYGLPFDFMANLLERYYPGILYLYNPVTDVYIEWQPLEKDQVQADSEILLIEDGVIYYRVNDMIYQREIIDGKELGERKLLVKDFRVPYIHWAFIPNEASFPCTQARSPIEKAICSSDSLCELDIQLDEVYKKAKAIRGESILQSQREWLKKRDMVYSGEENEIVEELIPLYKERINQLREMLN